MLFNELFLMAIPYIGFLALGLFFLLILFIKMKFGNLEKSRPVDFGNLKKKIIENVEITKLLHDGFIINWDGSYFYIDPFSNKGQIDFSKLPVAEMIFITHEHFDHLDLDAISKIVNKRTQIVGNKKVMEMVRGKFDCDYLEVTSGNIYNGQFFKTVPAYNVNKFREPGVPFHPKENDGLGFILDFEGIKIYHTGDTDLTPEMSELSKEKINIMLVPCSGTYVMTPEEASEAVKIIKPKTIIPMHCGCIVGGQYEVDRFKQLTQDFCKIVEM